MVNLSCLAPLRYLQGKNLLSRLGEFLKEIGENPVFLADKVVTSIIKDRVEESLYKSGFLLKFITFRGECCEPEIERVTEQVKKEKVDLIVGCGGGKTIDTARAAARFAGVSLVAIPTSAATCSAWSSTCPLYAPEGEYLRTLELNKNPELVLVDSQVIASAPVRLLSSGMGDSLAKWYEGEVTSRGKEKDPSVNVALCLSQKLREIIEENGPQAKIDTERKICSPEVERIIHANIVLAGLIGRLGGKSFRSAAAHAFNYSLTSISPTGSFLHGEGVAVGILVQFLLQGKSEEEFFKLVHFYRKIGLPCSLEELGIHLKDEDIEKISERFFKPGSSVYNLPFSVDVKMFREAIFEVNNLVKIFSRRSKFDDSIIAS